MPLGQPLAVGMQRGEFGLDLVVADDASLAGVDQEHLAGLQAALRNDLGGFDVDHADLGRHHDEIVVGHPVPAGAQAVAVEHRTDHLAVGERDAGRAVPGFHHRRVEPIEVALLLRHRLVVLPRLGDHHQHGVMDRVTPEVQQFEHLVEAGGVGRAGCADREGLVDAGQEVAVEHRLAGAHPVLVALHRVDLAVVGDEPVRVCERPRRERVGREPRVDQQERRLDARIEQVREELTQLGRGEHALVDHGARRQRHEVGVEFAFQLPSGPLAGDERLAVEFDAGRSGGVGHEELLERRHRCTRRLTQAVRRDRNLAPTEHLESGVVHGRLDGGHRLLARDGVRRQERHASGVRARCRKIELDDRSQEGVGHLDQDSGAVARVGFGARGATVLHVGERLQPGEHQLVRAHTSEVRDERHATRVVFVPGVVQADRARGLLHHHIRVSRHCRIP